MRHVRHLRPFAKRDVHLPGVMFAPVEMILVEEAGGRCSLTYVRPSSLMLVKKNDALLAAVSQVESSRVTLSSSRNAVNFSSAVINRL